MGKLRVYWLKTLKKLSTYPLGNTPSAPSAIQTFQLNIGRILIATYLSLRQIMKATGLVEDDGAQGTGVFHGQLEGRIPLLLARVVTDDTATEGGALIWVKSVMSQLATSHATDRMDKVATVKIFEPVLVWIMGVRVAVEVIGRRVLPTLFITSIL